MIKYDKTEVSELKGQIFEHFEVRLLIKREDQNHPYVSGNKWWKLKYNIEEARSTGQHTLLTFGGAYSNHIYATAAAAHELGLHSIGVIRGEETLPLNPTLAFATSVGMKLHYVSRENYLSKTDPRFIKQLNEQWGNFYLIPEGGTNQLAVNGCAEFGKQLTDEVDFDYLCLPVGTGGTMAGIMEGVCNEKSIIGFPVLKGAAFLEEEIRKYTQKENGRLIQEYHFGGYAKITKALMEFIRQFESQYDIPLDPVYTGKMMFGVLDLIRNKFFNPQSTILVIHTGGLQGRAEFNF